MAARLGRLAPLTHAEIAALGQIEGRERNWRRGAYLQRENEASDEIFMLHDGWVIAAALLDDGSRQIIQVHLPGELMGTGNLLLRRATQSLAAVTEVRATTFDRASLGRVLAQHPRIGAYLFGLSELNRIALADRLASLGRGSGRARISAFLLDLLRRLRLVDETVTDRFPLRLTQEQIGDATGLTAVHVNRMMRALSEGGLVERDGTTLRIIDEPALMRLAHYVDRPSVEQDWIPQPA